MSWWKLQIMRIWSYPQSCSILPKMWAWCCTLSWFESTRDWRRFWIVSVTPLCSYWSSWLLVGRLACPSPLPPTPNTTLRGRDMGDGRHDEPHFSALNRFSCFSLPFPPRVEFTWLGYLLHLLLFVEFTPFLVRDDTQFNWTEEGLECGQPENQKSNKSNNRSHPSHKKKGWGTDTQFVSTTTTLASGRSRKRSEPLTLNSRKRKP